MPSKRSPDSSSEKINKRSKSSQESFLGLPKSNDDASFLKRNLDKILDDQEIDPSAMIELIELPPGLIDEVFSRLAKRLKEECFPNGTVSESRKSVFVRELLNPIVRRVEKEFGIERLDLMLESYVPDPNEDSAFLPESAGRLAFVVRYKGLIKQNNFIIVEVKSGEIDQGVLQCGLHMIRASEHFGDNRIMYGCCTNAIQSNFMVYNPNAEPADRFKVLYRQTTMLPRMQKFETFEEQNEDGRIIEKIVYLRKDVWVKQCSAIPQLIYSCLVKQLKEEKEKEKQMALIGSLLGEFENDPEVENDWISNAIENMKAYFSQPSTVKASDLRLTSKDDLIYSTFRADFPQFKIDQIPEESLKSVEAKAKWREFSNKFANETDDLECATRLRLDSAGQYTESNTILVTPIQFLAIEIARNREGFNDSILEKFAKVQQAGLECPNFFAI